MRRLSNGLATMALGLVVLVAGQFSARHAGAEGSTRKRITLPGAATAKSIGSTLKGGVAKVGSMLTPSPSVKGSSDPLSLSTKADPSPELYLSMAAVAEESGNMAGARKHYEQALKLAPERFDVILQYARFRDRRDELLEATELYQRAIRSKFDEPSVFNDLGLCFARRGMLSQSLSSLERAIQLDPDRRLYRNNIATVLVEQGNVDAAFGHLKAVHDDAVAYYNLGYLKLMKGDSQAAARLFSEALAVNPALLEAELWLRKLEGNGAELRSAQPRNAQPRNAQRQGPQLRSATGPPPQPSGMPRLTMRPSTDEPAVRVRQFRTHTPELKTISPPPAVGFGRNPAYVAPLPPSTIVHDRIGPSTEIRLSVPERSTKPVPVFQPLPPIEN